MIIKHLMKLTKNLKKKKFKRIKTINKYIKQSKFKSIM
jgi:hypothetical protein